MGEYDPLEVVQFCPRCGKGNLEKVKTILLVKATCRECNAEFSVELYSIKEKQQERSEKITPPNPAWKYIDRQDL